LPRDQQRRHERRLDLAGGAREISIFPMKKLLLPLLALCAAASLSFGQAAAPTTPSSRVDASAPLEKKDATGKFQWMHQSFLARAKQPMDVLFLGDSITEGWTKAPHVWDHFYGMLRPANFGIGGDQTQHVIWRIENGELDGAKPKVVVLMLGTNNTSANANTAEEIAAADKKIVEMIRAKIPNTKVLLLAIFPRGARKNAQGVVDEKSVADAAHRTEVINAVNAQLKQLDDGKNVRYLDIGEKFLGQDGKIPWQLMPDQLHPTAAGYQLWAEAMEPLLREMLK
jgi:lysophospholipase L1-like esterase